MSTMVNSGTLTAQGIPWTYLRYNGKLAFGYGAHAIVFDIISGYYQIKERGETVFASKSVTECLANAAEYVWEYYAAQYVPSWEYDTLEVWMLEHYAQYFIPSWEAGEPPPIHGDSSESSDGCNQAA